LILFEKPEGFKLGIRNSNLAILSASAGLSIVVECSWKDVRYIYITGMFFCNGLQYNRILEYFMLGCTIHRIMFYVWLYDTMMECFMQRCTIHTKLESVLKCFNIIMYKTGRELFLPGCKIQCWNVLCKDVRYNDGCFR
jgi:hypothetical protein